MWKLAFMIAVLALPAGPLAAAQRDDGRRIEKTQRTEDLRRDVERISREIYRRSDERRPAGRR